MSSVTVLCPNGRRQIVKTTPNTTLLQVLEEVCTKQKFDRTQHQLKHGRKTLDLSLSIRFASLPNKAHLELVPGAGQQAGGAVSVALQLPSGDRLQHEFSASQTLWDVLQHWHAQEKLSLDEDSVPVCVYMRHEISSEATLKTTSLHSLGLTHGKAMIRLHFQESGAQPVSRPIASSEPVVPKTSDVEAVPHKGTPSSSEATVTAKDSSEHMDVENITQNNATNVSVAPAGSATVHQPSDILEKENVPSTEPMEVDKQCTGSSSDTPSSAVSPVETSTTTTAEPMEVGSPLQEASSASSNVESATPSTGVSPPDNTADRQPVATSASTTAAAMFKSQTSWPETGGYRLGSSTKSIPKTTTAARVDQPNPEEFQFDTAAYAKSQEPCERHPVLFHLHGGPSPDILQTENLPEEFFSLTAEDLRKMLQDLRTTYAESDLPLMTKAWRERQHEAKISSYDKVVVRVQFPDQLLLQGFFRPREPISAVMEMVRDYLADPTLDFYLYVAPPKQILAPSQTLAAARLIPAAKVFFGCSVDADHYVKKEHLSTLSTLIDADVITAKALPARITEKDAHKHAAGAQPVAAASPVSSSQSVKDDMCPSAEAKNQPSVPKWFKLGKH